MIIVRVNLGPRTYDIAVRSGGVQPRRSSRDQGLGQFARQRLRGTLSLVVTDEHVAEHARRAAEGLAAAGFQTATAVLPAGEAQKSLLAASDLYDRLAGLSADRQTVVVAVGGGVIGDLAGFVAATFARGLPWLVVPTTLLAMVDSSIGGKVGVNHPQAKNLIGAFHQPAGVWIDTATLATLPDREYRSGLAEVVKYGVILDADLFAYLEGNLAAILRREPPVVEHLVARCCRLKSDIVERDEREETGLRAILNYGHTFAHAFETAAGYSGWLHGEAVAAGMICAARLAERRGLVSAEFTQRQERLLADFGLPTRPAPWPIADLLAAMRRDKKAHAGRLRFVLSRRLADVAVFDDIPEADVQAILDEMTGA